MSWQMICPVGTGIRLPRLSEISAFWQVIRQIPRSNILRRTDRFYFCLSFLTKKYYPQKHIRKRWYILILQQEFETRSVILWFQKFWGNLVSAPYARGWPHGRNRVYSCGRICPVRTGMNLASTNSVNRRLNLPRTHGDEPEDYCLSGLLVASAPCARGYARFGKW